ncbi:unnamed protein product [Calicophoron daubneyi]|uniref:BHLH domain-containing protein n=1 Tax=Calicophoron daubneyi TaxID=300641 RepID=A0AAV2T2G6_CALDB
MISTMSLNIIEPKPLLASAHCQEIHSGHFMVSNIDDSESETEETEVLCHELHGEDSTRDVVDSTSSREKSWLAFEDLASLFKYLEIAYTGKLTSPKWNQFRGLRFAIKNKIRLNNIIWREYHMQFIRKEKPCIVHFQAPHTENHSLPEAVVMEGKYWKRRTSTICREYGLWRLFAKNRLHPKTHRSLSNYVDDVLVPSGLISFKNRQGDLAKGGNLVDSDDWGFSPSAFLDDIMMDFDENLDFFYQQPLTFPNPKDLALLGIGDIMQPGLLQFQPNPDSPQGEFAPQAQMPPTRFTAEGNRNTSSIRSRNISGVYQSGKKMCAIPEETSMPLNTSAFAYPSAELPVSENRFRGLEDPACASNLYPTKSNSDEAAEPGPINFGCSVLSYERQGEVSVDGGAYREPGDQNELRLHPPFEYVPGQQQSAVGRHSHIAKQYPTPSFAKNKNLTPANHQNEKTMKQLFHGEFCDNSFTERGESEPVSSTPTLLTALLHGSEPPKKITNNSTSPRLHQNDNFHGSCTVPLLCSALTTPLSTQSSLVRQSTQMHPQLKNDSSKTQPAFLEPHLYQVGTAPSLITDSQQPMEAGRTQSERPGGLYTVESSKADSNDLLMSAKPNSTNKDRYSGSILKAAAILPSLPLTQVTAPAPSFDTENFSTVQNMLVESTNAIDTEDLRRWDYVDSNAFASTRFTADSDSAVHTVPVGVRTALNSLREVHSDRLQNVELKPMNAFSADQMEDVIKSEVEPISLMLGSPPNTRVVERARLSCPVSKTTPSSSGFPHSSSFSSQAGFSHQTETGRHRTISAHEYSDLCGPQTVTLSQDIPCERGKLTQNFEDKKSLHSWQRPPEKEELSFFLPASSSELGAVPGSEPDKGMPIPVFRNSNESTLSSKGRSNSAGNLFALPQPLLTYGSKPDSTATMSSYSSNEVLSPTLCTQSGVAYTSSSPSSPHNTFEVESSTKSPVINTSEERRRRSMHTGLQTLKQLIRFHSTLEGPAGGSRLAARRRADGRDLSTTLSTVCQRELASREYEESKEELLPLLMRPTANTECGLEGSFSTPGSEGNSSGRTSKAATLRNAADLIRRMRDERNALDAQCRSFRNEIGALRAAINTCCEKLPPSGAAPSRQTAEYSLTSHSREWFRFYVQKQTEISWKFYIFSLIVGELFESYCAMVNTVSQEHFVRSLFGWLDQHCSLVHLRPAITQAMCELSRTTAVLQDPTHLPDQARRAAAASLSGLKFNRSFPGWNGHETRNSDTLDAGKIGGSS